MRTTLDIADDVLQAAKERARREKKTAGQVISDLARRALTAPRCCVGGGGVGAGTEGDIRLKPFARRGGVVTNELIDNLRDEDGG